LKKWEIAARIAGHCCPWAFTGILLGCSTPATRIRAHPEVVAGLDEKDLAKIRRGEIAVGYSAAMVELALGKPLSILTAAGEDPVWLYQDRPRNDADFVSGGFRRRVVFDPVIRGNVVVVESVDDRTFPSLRSHTIKIAFKNGKVVAISSEEII
jgi:hypothetical protein